MRKTGGKPVNWQQLHLSEAAENLQSSERGLASKEARHRYEHYGPNELIGKGKKKAWKILVMGLISVGTGYWFWRLADHGVHHADVLPDGLRAVCAQKNAIAAYVILAQQPGAVVGHWRHTDPAVDPHLYPVF
ncbi:cation-transporting P-type ATPase [Desulfocurvus vexinensis]|uniref:cation-transporting P-type ATPase n=1 Tax=Desulfocurvus vexinensis TaxID=399548 RepID=UPI001B7FB253|nr:cation-transporting P-type ATPase [Desulfocurvus vexinensis]